MKDIYHIISELTSRNIHLGYSNYCKLHLVEKIINHIRILVPVRLNSTETIAGKPLLHQVEYSLGRKCIWNYRAAVGILSYLQGSARPEIPMSVHQCDFFCNITCILHKHSVKCIAKYLVRIYTYMDSTDGNQWLSTHGVIYMTYK